MNVVTRKLAVRGLRPQRGAGVAPLRARARTGGNPFADAKQGCRPAPAREPSSRTLSFLFAICLATAAGAVEPDERLADPAQEARARALSTELRCLVCQNQSIDDSNAPLARDLRLVVREQIKAGRSDSEVMGYIVDRYGEFVLLRPRFGWHTLALWLAPLLVLAGAAIAIGQRMRAPHLARSDAPLTRDEQARLDDIIGRE